MKLAIIFVKIDSITFNKFHKQFNKELPKDNF